MTVSLSGGVRHPKIYAYTTPEYENTEWIGGRSGEGLLKVGYTDRDVDVRIREQLDAVQMPKQTPYEVLLAESAITDEGLAFTDHDIHKLLKKNGDHPVKGEWFEVTKDEVAATIRSLKTGAAVGPMHTTFSFEMRPEQKQAVAETADYFTAHFDPDNPPHFLWNAKMRFGKTFTAYQLAKQMGWTRLLVLTYKPAVEVAWREDLVGHTDFAGWRFKGKEDDLPDFDDKTPLVWFASFQDVLGTDEDGHPKAKNLGLYDVAWDAVIIDEYHFGAWRDAARGLYLGDKETGSDGDASEKAALTPLISMKTSLKISKKRSHSRFTTFSICQGLRSVL